MLTDYPAVLNLKAQTDPWSDREPMAYGLGISMSSDPLNTTELEFDNEEFATPKPNVVPTLVSICVRNVRLGGCRRQSRLGLWRWDDKIVIVPSLSKDDCGFGAPSNNARVAEPNTTSYLRNQSFVYALLGDRNPLDDDPLVRPKLRYNSSGVISLAEQNWKIQGA
jgi:hypothetical protein